MVNNLLNICHRPNTLGGFPCGSAGKESACNAGGLGLILGLGRSPGEGKGYPLQYSGLENSIDSTVHGVAKWEPTPVFLPGESQGRGSLVGCRLWGRTESDTTELTMEKAMASHSSALAWKIPWTEEPGRLQSMRSLRVGYD